MFVDSDHASGTVSRKSRTGFFIFINMAPITWYSKKQGTIDSSVFGADFMVLKTTMDSVRGFCINFISWEFC